MKKTIINLTPKWVTGFADAEGNFSINYSAKSKKVGISFKITQKGHSKDVLYALKEFFKCGEVYTDNKKHDGYKFQVSSKKDIISNIIPHFDKHPLITSKNLDFLSLKKCIELLNNKNENLESIISIKKGMNNGRSDYERYKYLSKPTSIYIDPDWLQGFIDGEGCFYSYMGKNNTFINTLEVSQSYHEVALLEAIKLFFGSGSINPKYDLNDFSKLKEKYKYTFRISNSKTVISFISQHNMLTRKHLDYLDWVRIVKLKNSKAYKTSHGLKLMHDIKQGMNTGRDKVIVRTVMSKLFDFAQGGILFIIFVVAFIANGIDEDNIFDNHIHYESYDSSNHQHDDSYDSKDKVVPWFDGLTETEIKYVEIQIQNLANFNDNNKIEIIKSDVAYSASDIANIISLIQGIKPNNATNSEIEMSETAIREIKSGNSPTFWVQDDSDSASLKELNRLSRRSEGGDVASVEEHSSTDFPKDNSENANHVTSLKRVVIVTQPAGDTPAPLPSWTTLPPAPSVDSDERTKWLRDVAERKYWSSRIEWIDAGRPLDKIEIDKRTQEWILNTPSDTIPNDSVEPENVPIPHPSISESKTLQGSYIIHPNGERVYDETKETLKNQNDSLAVLEKHTKK